MDADKISFQKIKLIVRHNYFKTVVVFLVFLLIFLGIHLGLNPHYFNSTDDPYYHAEHSRLMAESGNYFLIKPWLTLHFLSYAPTDPWWGSHVLQALFIKFSGDAMLGTKIYIACLDAAIFAIFYFILRELGARRAWFWTILYFSTSAMFLNRLLYERPYLWALIMIPLSFYYWRQKKYSYLFLLAFIYTLIYNLSLFILLIPALGILLQYVYKQARDYRLIVYPGLGIILGILVHPESLNYIRVISIHILKVVFLRLAGVDLGIGGEVSFQDGFIGSNLVPIFLYIIAFALWFNFKELRKKNEINLLFFISLFWFLINIVVPRAIEYWFPVAMIFSALIFTAFQATADYQLFIIKARSLVNKFSIIIFFSLSVLGIIIFHNFSDVYLNIKEVRESKILGNIENVNQWLVQNTAAGSTIFYNDWSFWPTMFYFNQGYNKFLMGMDPTFTYEQDHHIFWIWRNLSLYGIYCDRQDLCPELSARASIAAIKVAFRDIFKTEFILTIKSPNNGFYSFLTADTKDYQRAYDNEQLAVFKLR